MRRKIDYTSQEISGIKNKTLMTDLGVVLNESKKLFENIVPTVGDLLQIMSLPSYQRLFDKIVNLFLVEDPEITIKKLRSRLREDQKYFYPEDFNEHEAVQLIKKLPPVSAEQLVSTVPDSKQTLLHMIFHTDDSARCLQLIEKFNADDLLRFMEIKDDHDITPLHHLFGRQSQQVCSAIIQKLPSEGLARACSIRNKIWHVTPLDILFMTEHVQACSEIIEKLTFQQISMVLSTQKFDVPIGYFLFTDIGTRLKKVVTCNYYGDEPRLLFGVSGFLNAHIGMDKRIKLDIWRPNTKNYLALISKLMPQEYLKNIDFLFRTSLPFNVNSFTKYSEFLKLFLSEDWGRCISSIPTLTLSVIIDNVDPLLASALKINRENQDLHNLINILRNYQKYFRNTLTTARDEPAQFIDFMDKMTIKTADLRFLNKIVDEALRVIPEEYINKLKHVKFVLSKHFIEAASIGKWSRDEKSFRHAYRREGHSAALAVDSPIKITLNSGDALLIGESLTVTFQAAYRQAVQQGSCAGEITLGLAREHILPGDCHSLSRKGLEYLICAESLATKDTIRTLVLAYYLNLSITSHNMDLVGGLIENLPDSKETGQNLLRTLLQELNMRSERLSRLGGVSWFEFCNIFFKNLNKQAFFQDQLVPFKFQFEIAVGLAKLELAIKIIDRTLEKLTLEMSRVESKPSHSRQVIPLTAIQNHLQRLKMGLFAAGLAEDKDDAPPSSVLSSLR